MIKDIQVQTYLNPKPFIDIINSHPEEIKKLCLNQQNDITERYHHKIIYNEKIFTTITEEEIFDM